MQWVTYGFFGLIGVLVVGFAYIKLTSGKDGKKLVKRGMEMLQKGDFSNAYDCFATALPQTLGSPEYPMAVQGLARAYKMSGTSADVGQLLLYGRDVQNILKDPRVDKAKRKMALSEVRERIARQLKDLGQL
jgi:hypothetical protein